MRSPEEIKSLVIDNARNDERVRAVLLNGSRANSKALQDKYQDFDIVYVVNDIKDFISDESWTRVFGDRLIRQLPDEMFIVEKNPEKIGRFAMLMLFADGNRIDLTLVAKTEIKADYKPGSLTIVWLDKDNLFENIGLPNDSDHLVKQPTEKEFLDTCNEFWWVCTYVAKGLMRNEIIYSKEMLDTVVRPMFMKVISWYIGTETDFSVSTGKGGRFMKNYLAPGLYNDILKTYADYTLQNSWKALFLMMEIFGTLAQAVSAELKFRYITSEQENVVAYLNQLFKEQANDNR